MVEENKTESAQHVEAPMEKAERLIKELTEKVQKAEELLTRQVLSGRADAGQEPAKPPEESAKEYKNRIMGVRK